MIKLYTNNGRKEDDILSRGIYINDSIHGLIQLSEYEKRIISSIGFNRLHDVYQNSTVYLTFPTNRTKRFEHSLGTMKIASDMFYRSVLNSSRETLNSFYSQFLKEIENVVDEVVEDSTLCESKLAGKSPKRKKICDLDIELDQMRHSLIPSNVSPKDRIIHCILCESIRVTALLHDIGHPPFSHIVENAIKNEYKKYKNKPNYNKRVSCFCKTMNNYFEEGRKLHEQMGDEISQSILEKVVPYLSDREHNVEKYNKNLYEIIVAKCVLKILTNHSIFSNLHAIVDGPLDGDRLDYVTRDSLNSGMDSGKIEYQRIINDMKLQEVKGNFYFCVPQKAVNSVEDFAKRRLSIYKNIIYHHRVIKTDSLLQFSVEKMIDIFLQKNDDIPEEKDNIIPYDINGLWYPLGNDRTHTERENALSQWNDSWLMTILKQIYYSKYYQKNINISNDGYVLSKQMTELLCNTKKYFSLVKRRENFLVIDEAFSSYLYNKKDEIITLIKEIRQLSDELPTKIPKDTVSVNIEPTLTKIIELFDYQQKVGTLALRYAKKNAFAFSSVISDFECFIKDKTLSTLKKHFTKSDLCDIMIVFKPLSSGLEKPIYFYAPHDNSISTLEENSGVCNILTIEAESSPVFYVYLLLEDGAKIEDDERKKILQKIGREIAKDFVKKIKELLNDTKKEMENLKCVK